MEDKKLLCKQDFEAAQSRGTTILGDYTHVKKSPVKLFQIVMMAASDHELQLQHAKWKC